VKLHVVTDPGQLYAGHMTIYPGGQKERLHGHNFRIFLELALSDGSFAAMIDLDVARDALTAICNAWRGLLLLPAKNPMLEVVRDDGDELEVRICGDRYVMPRRDAVFLPIVNASVEGLAEHVADLLAEPLGTLAPVSGYDVRIEELPGIGASVWRTVR
jgi:6-pyruvoyltetrahydropterin/6-carboxytetrahydropterin synthase